MQQECNRISKNRHAGIQKCRFGIPNPKCPESGIYAIQKFPGLGNTGSEVRSVLLMSIGICVKLCTALPPPGYHSGLSLTILSRVNVKYHARAALPTPTATRPVARY
uniref:Uncharacterized protein n=1 Tax=Globodera rostochiensis TaxID=31243 RepID=A0A914GPE4_GLORO